MFTSKKFINSILLLLDYSDWLCLCLCLCLSLCWRECECICVVYFYNFQIISLAIRNSKLMYLTDASFLCCVFGRRWNCEFSATNKHNETNYIHFSLFLRLLLLLLDNGFWLKPMHLWNSYIYIYLSWFFSLLSFIYFFFHYF